MITNGSIELEVSNHDFSAVICVHHAIKLKKLAKIIMDVADLENIEAFIFQIKDEAGDIKEYGFENIEEGQINGSKMTLDQTGLQINDVFEMICFDHDFWEISVKALAHDPTHDLKDFKVLSKKGSIYAKFDEYDQEIDD